MVKVAVYTEPVFFKWKRRKNESKVCASMRIKYLFLQTIRKKIWP
jgi:hypothetical protein